MELHPPTVEARVAELGDSVEKGDVAEKGEREVGRGVKLYATHGQQGQSRVYGGVR
jgi:hypothetical protein